jgi:hypothetical protein
MIRKGTKKAQSKKRLTVSLIFCPAVLIPVEIPENKKLPRFLTLSIFASDSSVMFSVGVSSVVVGVAVDDAASVVTALGPLPPSHEGSEERTVLSEIL